MYSLKLILILLISLAWLSFAIPDEKSDDNAIREYVKQLGDSNFSVREKATKELIKVSFKNINLLTEELKKSTDLEIQERLKGILDQSEEKLNELFGDKINKSQQLLEDKKYAEALVEVNDILDIRPEYAKGLDLKIHILQLKADYKECLLLLKSQLEKTKKDSREYENIALRLSIIMLTSGEFSDAVTLLEKLIIQTRYPEKIQSLLQNAYELNNQNEKAEDLLLKEIKENPMDERANTAIAWFYFRIGKAEKAKPYLEKYFSLNKESKEIDVTEVLNLLLSEQNQKGAEKLKLTTDPILADCKAKKNLAINEFRNDTIFFLCYQYYFEKMSNQKLIIDFKGLYNSFNDEDKIIWPVPLLGLYGGVLTVEKMESQIQNLDKWQMRMDKCEAYFYLGLLRVCENNNKDAKKYFQMSKEQKVYEYIETTGDSFMLQKLK